MREIINKITARDRMFGSLCLEAEKSFSDANYFSALACLFILTEQIIKYSLHKNEGNFYSLTLQAKEKGLIDDSEFQTINSLRDFRNKLFHENHYSLGVEIGAETYLVSENETKKLVYEQFNKKVFSLVLRLVQ